MREKYNHKLTTEQKEEIGRLYHYDEERPTYHKLGQQFGVSHTMVQRLVKAYEKKYILTEEHQGS